jgi:hypothetical protein
MVALLTEIFAPAFKVTAVLPLAVQPVLVCVTVTVYVEGLAVTVAVVEAAVLLATVAPVHR